MVAFLGSASSIGSGSAAATTGAAALNPWGFAATLGVNLALSFLPGLLFGKPKPPPRRIPEFLVTSRGTVEPHRYVYGTTRVAAFVPYFQNATGARYIHYVLVASRGEIDEFTALWIDDRRIDLTTEVDGSGFVTKAAFINGDGDQLVRVTLHNGTPTQAADANMVAEIGEWTTAHQGKSTAYIALRLEIDASEKEPNVFAKGPPSEFHMELRGRKIFDPRTSTTAYSSNPAIILRDYLLNVVGLPLARLDDDAIETAADICDEQVGVLPAPGGVPTLQNRYEFNGTLTLENSRENVYAILATMRGIMPYTTEGQYVPIAGSWTAPVDTLTDDDGPIKIQTGAGHRERYNAVRGTFTDAARNYRQTDFDPRDAAELTASADIEDWATTEDGQTLWRDIELPDITDHQRALRLAVGTLKQSRNQRLITMPCKPKAARVAFYETVTLDIDGLTTRTARVVGARFRADWSVELQLIEDSEEAWDVDPLTELIDAPVPTAPGDDLGQPRRPSSISATAVIEGIELDVTVWLPPGVLLEIWSATTNDRSLATRVYQGRSKQFTHVLNSANTTRYYWARVTDTASIASDWEPASATAGTTTASGAANDQTTIPQASAGNVGSIIIGGNPLTSVSGLVTATITVAARSVQYGGFTVAYDAGSITGVAINALGGGVRRYYVYADDPTYAGGAVTYVATESFTQTTAGSGRVYFGWIFVRAQGASPATGIPGTDTGAGSGFSQEP